MNKRIAGTFFVGLFLIAGCASSKPELANSTEDITGTFASTGGATYARFDENGTYSFAPSLMLVNDPIYPPGEYWFEGNELHIMPIEDPVCDDITAVYEVWLPESGELRFVAIDDACEHRMAVLQGVIDAETGEPSTRWLPVE